MKAGKKILATALDWGLGHATRMVPLLAREVANGASLVLAPTPEQEVIWREAFPDAVFLEGIPHYGITFPEHGAIHWHLLRQWPAIRRTMQAEQKFVEAKAHQLHIDTIISDNRYGSYARGIRSVLVTHQLHLPLAQPWRTPAEGMMRQLLRPFQEIWVPDAEVSPALSGKLAHPPTDPRVRYIGPLSRLKPITAVVAPEAPIAVIISGPEPHRSRFLEKMKHILKELPFQAVVVCGQPAQPLDYTDGQVRVVSHLKDHELAGLLCEARAIVCRSGYSTLMDLYALNKKALLVPTKGQAEQEYLARHFNEQFGWPTIAESAIDPTSLRRLLAL